MRRCKVCRTEIPAAAKCTSMVGKKGLCSPDCAASWWELEKDRKYQEKLKRDKQDRKVRREALKTPTDYANEAQKAVNAYVRLRDEDRPCVSCSRHHAGQYHAGHFRSRGAANHLRFNLLNLWKQCQPCNEKLSGNVLEYRKHLVELIGVDRVEAIENDNRVVRFDIDYLKRLKSIFNRRARHIERLRKSIKQPQSIHL